MPQEMHSKFVQKYEGISDGKRGSLDHINFCGLIHRQHNPHAWRSCVVPILVLPSPAAILSHGWFSAIDHNLTGTFGDVSDERFHQGSSFKRTTPGFAWGSLQNSTLQQIKVA